MKTQNFKFATFFAAAMFIFASMAFSQDRQPRTNTTFNSYIPHYQSGPTIPDAVNPRDPGSAQELEQAQGQYSGQVSLNAEFGIQQVGKNEFIFAPATMSANVSYTWNFGDGKFSEEPAPEHKFKKGTYTVQLFLSVKGKVVATTARTMTVAY